MTDSEGYENEDQQKEDDDKSALVIGNWAAEGCPVCGDSVNGVLGPENSLKKPQKGEWCFHNGHIFIHEMLVWDLDDPEGDFSEIGVAGSE